jgi:hypothetical protein
VTRSPADAETGQSHAGEEPEEMSPQTDRRTRAAAELPADVMPGVTFRYVDAS